jgi:hypothetical protein
MCASYMAFAGSAADDTLLLVFLSRHKSERTLFAKAPLAKGRIGGATTEVKSPSIVFE